MVKQILTWFYPAIWEGNGRRRDWYYYRPELYNKPLFAARETFLRHCPQARGQVCLGNEHGAAKDKMRYWGLAYPVSFYHKDGVICAILNCRHYHYDNYPDDVLCHFRLWLSQWHNLAPLFGSDEAIR